jgi:hypothetical protein
MPEHCEHKFVVYELIPRATGGFYPGLLLDDKVHFCPFCGTSLETPVVPVATAVDEVGSPAPKRFSKRGQTGIAPDGKIVHEGD